MKNKDLIIGGKLFVRILALIMEVPWHNPGSKYFRKYETLKKILNVFSYYFYLLYSYRQSSTVTSLELSFLYT